MRHSTGRVDFSGADYSQAQISQAKATKSHVSEVASQRYRDDALQSLRSHLPQARYFAGDDVQYSEIAASIETASTGQLVIYRIGHQCPSKFMADALALGVAGILTEQMLPCPLPQCIVGDMDLALAELSANQLDRPDRKLLTIGVTGSAGKTTTTLMIASILNNANVRTAYQTDLGECDGIVQSTPEGPLATAAPLVQWLGDAVDNECGAAIIELDDSSITYGHYDAIELDLLVVTGPAQSSDSFGPSSLQCALERMSSDGVVITPADDPRVERVVRESGLRMVTYGTHRAADVTAKIIDQSGGMSTLLVTTDDTTAAMETSLCGGAMAACHCAAVTVGLLIDQPLPTILETLGKVRQLPGRMQPIASFGQPTIYLDIAGSPKRLAASLRATRSMQQRKLWCVLSLTGHESSVELAEYGRIAERFAGQVILTCHPGAKSEFLQLAHSVLDGVKKCAAFRWVADWNQAIQWTIAQANASDTVLVVGGVRRENAQEQRRQLSTLQSWIEKSIERRIESEPANQPQLKIFG